jgi:hypothetical protein
MTSLGPSIIRTFVPILVTILGPTVARETGVDSETLASVLGAVIGGAYYYVARQLERRNAKAGWMLLYPVEPVYVPKHVQ